MRHLGLCAALLALGCLGRPAAADLTQDLHTFALTGTWTAAAGDPQPSWQVGARGLTLALPESPANSYTAERAEPLPEGDWTLSTWLAEYPRGFRGLFPAPVALCLGEPGRQGYTELEFARGSDGAELRVRYQAAEGRPQTESARCRWVGAPVVWLRLVRRGDLLLAWVNGQQMRDILLLGRTALKPARGPVRFCVRPSVSVLYPADVRVASFRVAAGAQIPVAQKLGPAYDGWSVRPRVEPAAARAMVADLERLSADRSFDANGRAYILAALVLARRAAGTPMDTALWDRIRRLVMETDATSRDGLSMLLPVAVASATPLQRREAASCVTAFFGPLLEPTGYLVKARGRPDVDFVPRIVQRAVLLDPARASTAAAAATPYWFSASWWTARELARLAPDGGLAAWTLNPYPQGEALAWYLPDMWAASRNFGELIAEWFLDADTEGGARASLDRVRSFAAYRMAPVDPTLALRLADRIAAPDVKDETLRFVVPRLALPAQPDVVERVDRYLKEAAGRVGADDTSGRLRAHVLLGRWCLALRRTADARKATADAVADAAAIAKPTVTDLWAVAELAMDAKDPSADLSLHLAMQAVARPPSAGSSGDGQQSAAMAIVDRLLRDGRQAEAVRFVRTLTGTGRTYSTLMAMVVMDRSRSDVPGALALWRSTPRSEAADPATAVLAGRLARTDPAGALAVAYGTTGWARGEALVAIARAGVPRGPIRTALVTALGDEVSRVVSGWSLPGTVSYPWVGMAPDLAGLPYDVVRDMRPLLGGAPGLYALLLPYAVARTCGFERDPLWAGLRLIVPPYWAEPVPYQGVRLSDAVHTERRAAGSRDPADQPPPPMDFSGFANPY